MSWIRSISCSGPWQTLTPDDDTSLLDRVQEWIAYIVFAECPQHSIVSLINLAFLVAAASQLLCCRLRGFDGQLKPAFAASSPRRFKAGLKFHLPLALTACLAAASTGVAAFGLWDGVLYGWGASYIREEIFSVVEAVSWIASLCVLIDARRRSAPAHPGVLRAWWFFTFLTSVLSFLSSLFRLTSSSDLPYDLRLWVSDIYALVRFPVTIFLLLAALSGATGIEDAANATDNLKEPLLSGNGALERPLSVSVSGFANAGFVSKITFSWLTPLLVAGSKRSLEAGDVPQLSPNDRAENMSKLFQSNSRQRTSGSRNSLGVTLMKCFWPQFLFAGFLQLVRSIFMFGGPLLISSFTEYASGESVSRYDGYSLVILLLIFKTVEVFSYHQCNFQCYKLGNNVRTAVVTTLYRKGLRLSSSARISHGVGQITNYMVVDAQQLSDACLQLHFLWSIPFQVICALAILYTVIGVASLAGLGTMVIVAASALYISGKQRGFQELLMKGRDMRMKAINEALHYMKVIKLQAWEDYFREKIEARRHKEYDALRGFVFCAGTNMFLLWNTQPLVLTVTYVVALFVGATLTTARLFTAASLFRILQDPLRNFPLAIITFSQTLVALDRINRFLGSSELQQDAVTRCPQVDEHPLVIDRGNFAWEEAERTPVLRDIDLNIKLGSLVTIVGTVGSGKSSLLSAVLGEMFKVSGSVKLSGSVAYVAQTTWIQNATIEDNILFGASMEEVRYRQVLRACALETDLAAMDHGDQTEIGEKGINLSGGQKQRIQLARAVYQNCDVYLLDDVFSAVDAQTGAQLFKECILGVLRGKTILLVTHQVEFLSGADLVLVLKDGKIAQSGKYTELLTPGTELEVLVEAHNKAMDLVDIDRPKRLGNDEFDRTIQQLPERSSFETVVSTEELVRSIPISTAGLMEKLSSGDYLIEYTKTEGPVKLIEEEQREVGQVSLKVYWLYLTKVYGWAAVALLLGNQCIWQALLLGSDFWLADEIPTTTNTAVNKRTFIIVYTVLNVTSMINVLIRVVLVASLGLRTALQFFLEMLQGIFSAPMYFFDTTPSGRMLSRFSADQTNLDFMLHFYFGGVLGNIFATIGIIIVICISAWPMLFMIVPFLFIFYMYQKFYITSSREITRLDSITKAPLIYHFSETVSGIDTIRSFGKEQEFLQQNIDRVNTNMKMDFHNNSATEWLGLRLESLGSIILCTAAFFFVVLPEGTVSPALVSLALSYALGLNANLYSAVFLFCNVENKMVSVERIRQFTEIPTEASRVIESCLPSPNWPYNGKIVSKRLKLRYRKNTPLVLKGVNFTIQGGHKVGFVGRTGSGKSTLIQALFRLVEASSGQILVDDVDISTLGLYDLRSRFGIIPQEPVLFEGTIRMNVDPLGIYTDEEIWKGLEKCQLASILQERPAKLDSQVAEYGGNWSVGQSQLLCFVRVLLKRSRILFLDEATASVDSQTDAVIQSLVREEFVQCTVVSIAHRIPTVMDADKVLVMDAGRVKEFDSPQNLLNNPKSLFTNLVQEYATRSGRSH